LSSILTALKKLENQAKNKSPVRFREQKNKEQPPKTRRMIEGLRVNKRYLIILAGLIFAGAAGITLSQKIRSHHPKVGAKTMVGAKKETRTQSPARPSNQKPILSNRVEKKSLPSQKIKEPDRTKIAPKMSPAPIFTSRAAPVMDLNKKALPPKEAEKGTVLGKANEKHKPQVKPERYASVPVKQSGDTNIEIQAIAWSKNPKSRLAVINGLILREGESIDNVMVVDIGRDAVVFEKDRDEWKQLFGF
jgi:Type II secretion system protein B